MQTRFTRTVLLRDATSSLQAFEAVLALGDDPTDATEILQTIADYNRDDCVSTWRLREWLETLRTELEAKLGTNLKTRVRWGDLEYVGVVEETKRSFIHRYQFQVQDHAIDRALEVHDPRTKNSAGTLVDIGDINLTVDLKRGKILEKPHPTALTRDDYVGSKKKSKA